MFDSIYIGMSGLEGFSKGLKVISNNVANLNTPGFKASTLQFTDAYYQQGGEQGYETPGGEGSQFGTGLSTLSSVIDFQPGELQQTDNTLDVNISGNGYLVTEGKTDAAQHYTRDGQLQFDKDNNLVSTTTGRYVMGYATSGSQQLSKISLDGLLTNPAKATSSVTFTGNLTSGPSSSDSTQVTETPLNIAVNDALGGQHSLKLDFKNKGTAAAPSNEWTVTVTDGSTTVATGTIGFTGAQPTPGEDSMSFLYSPTGGVTPFNVKLDFSANVTSYSEGNLSSLAVASQDGYAAGSISSTQFDANGKLQITYSNGQTATGAQLALADFNSNTGLQQLSAGEFVAANPNDASVGRPGADGSGTIGSGEIEMSNVDLSNEFSNLIVMQRGYQAASNVISTANDMLQQLFDMRSGASS